MRQALLVLATLSMVTTAAAPAFAQACGDEGRYFHLAPPSWSIPSARRHAIHRMARALRWYREHLGNTPLCPGSNIAGITVTGVVPGPATNSVTTTTTTTTTKTKKSK
ncbi:MAG TPA: hypothetical protein V6C69_10025 [Trichormus sp.]|jgi:hypothetical protein